MKGTIIFDFDDTLFNTKKFKDDYFQLLTETGLTASEIQELYSSFSKTAQSKTNRGFEDFLSQKGYPVTTSLKERFNSFDLNVYVKHETVSTLENLKKDFILVLLTKGEEVFQTWKVNGSGLSSFFSEVITTEGNKEEILSQKSFLEPVFFINDKSEENFAVKQNFPSWTVLHTHEYVVPVVESGILVSSLSNAEKKIRDLL